MGTRDLNRENASKSVGSERRLSAAAAAAATGILIGATLVATRVVLTQTTPTTLTLLRYTIGVICLLPFHALSRHPSISRRDMFPIAVLGVAQFAVLIQLLNYALVYISAAQVALIFATMPVMTMLVSVVRDRKSWHFILGVGVLCTIAGVALILGSAIFEKGDGPGFWRGILLAFAGTGCGAVCSILYRPYLEKYSPLRVGTAAMTASVIAVAIVGGRDFLYTAARISPSGWFCIIFIGVSGSLGFYLWLWAFRHSTATRVTVFLSLSPITATLIGTFYFKSSIDPLFAAGLLVTLIGLCFSQRSSVP